MCIYIIITANMGRAISLLIPVVSFQLPPVSQPAPTQAISCSEDLRHLHRLLHPDAETPGDNWFNMV